MPACSTFLLAALKSSPIGQRQGNPESMKMELRHNSLFIPNKLSRIFQPQRMHLLYAIFLLLAGNVCVAQEQRPALITSNITTCRSSCGLSGSSSIDIICVLAFWMESRDLYSGSYRPSGSASWWTRSSGRSVMQTGSHGLSGENIQRANPSFADSARRCYTLWRYPSREGRTARA